MSKREEFPAKVKVAAFERANGRCESCRVKIRPGIGPEFDHVVPVAVKGGNDLINCMVLCRNCHGAKTSKADIPAIARTKRIHRKHIGAKARSRKPMPGSRASGWKHRMDGSWERRDGQG